MAGRGGLWFIDPATGEGEELITGSGFIMQARVSPDGRWLAYMSDESGAYELYVHGLEGQGRWQISDGEGAQPLFSLDGGEIYYRSGRNVMVVEISPEGDALRPGRPRVLYEASEGATLGVPMAGTVQYDYSTLDGEVFIEAVDALSRLERPEQRGVIILNWLERLRRMAAEQN